MRIQYSRLCQHDVVHSGQLQLQLRQAMCVSYRCRQLANAKNLPLGTSQQQCAPGELEYDAGDALDMMFAFPV